MKKTKTRVTQATEAYWAKPSPLGLSSQTFQEKKNSKGAILDQPDRGTLELYPAGFTKPSLMDGVSRQQVHKAIYEQAQKLGTSEDLYPFGKTGTHSIQLVPLHDNEWDPNATMIQLVADSDSPLAHLNGRDLGFIPLKISSLVKRNISMFTGGAILKTRAEVYKRYWQCKVILSYGEAQFAPLDRTARNRFAAIMGE